MQAPTRCPRRKVQRRAGFYMRAAAISVRFAVAALAIAPMVALAAPVSQQPVTAVPAPSTDQGEAPFKPQNFPARGDALDAWCRQVKSGSVAAMCSDNELRAAAIERLRVFDQTLSRLPSDQQSALVADQNGWAMSYPQGCGLWANVLPTLPLSPEIKECMVKAGQARLAYLRAYGMPAGTPSPASPEAKAAAPPAAPQVPQPQANPAVQLPAAVPAPAVAANAPAAPETPPAPAPAAPASAKPTPSTAAASQPAASPAAPITPKDNPPPALPMPASPRLSASAPPPSSNPIATRMASLGVVRGTAVAAGILLAAATIIAWIWAMIRNGRRGLAQRR